MADEPIIVDEDDGTSPETPEETNAFSDKLDIIRERCKLAKVEFVEETNPDGDKFGIIYLNSGRSKRRINIFG